MRDRSALVRVFLFIHDKIQLLRERSLKFLVDRFLDLLSSAFKSSIEIFEYNQGSFLSCDLDYLMDYLRNIPLFHLLNSADLLPVLPSFITI